MSELDKIDHFLSELQPELEPQTLVSAISLAMKVTEDEPEETEQPWNLLNWNRSGLKYAEVQVNGQKWKAMIDTGANCSRIPKKVADKLGLKLEPINADAKMRYKPKAKIAQKSILIQF